jgi:hypothetical protein
MFLRTLEELDPSQSSALWKPCNHDSREGVTFAVAINTYPAAIDLATTAA